MSKLENSPIRIKSFQFACDIVFFTRSLKEKKEFELASQLLRSGTSIGANVREAQRGVSTKDFKNKFGIALKEADETKYWLELIEATSNTDCKILIAKCDELMKIMVSIIKNS
ncbi:four helix bundle protein [Salinimicrobium catena]|uniref:Four helix bundle protein n=1 Tax=Salinimicrobium catena TaxID=390640 RepID=A0A1H5IDN6_9FLAO|nr:four helix bundle protein [Salinimicrobium catena]SDK76923.1 four helix bundle protein [Salinimicrobium catena]SEE38296.1 four helix bundle protein [Salinimicrobium catena]